MLQSTLARMKSSKGKSGKTNSKIQRSQRLSKVYLEGQVEIHYQMQN